MPGTLMYIAGLEDIVKDHPRNPGRIIIGRRISEEPTNGRTKLPTAGLGSFTDSFTDMD